MAAEWRPSNQQHYWTRPDYREDSWRLEETCCRSISCERPSAYADVKNYNNNNSSLGENETYKYKGILEADTMKQVEMKDKIQKEYLRRTRKLLETKLSSRNLTEGIDTWVVPLVRYSGQFL